MNDKKTAIQQVFSELEKLHPNLFNIYTSEGKEFVNHFHKYLEIEKEQMFQSLIWGCEVYDAWDKELEFKVYYNETFKTKQDEPI